jgi:AhpD family alkylhydroperoxidase
MTDLNPRESELVALGAAMGSNCVPCIEYHIPEARKAGISDELIHAAVHLADRVRRVPAQKVLEAALKALPNASGAGSIESDKAGPCSGASAARASNCC